LPATALHGLLRDRSDDQPARQEGRRPDIPIWQGKAGRCRTVAEAATPGRRGRLSLTSVGCLAVGLWLLVVAVLYFDWLGRSVG